MLLGCCWVSKSVGQQTISSDLLVTRRIRFRRIHHADRVGSLKARVVRLGTRAIGVVGTGHVSESLLDPALASRSIESMR